MLQGPTHFKNHCTLSFHFHFSQLVEHFFRITMLTIFFVQDHYVQNIVLRISLPLFTMFKISYRGRQVDKQEAKKKLFLDFQVLHLWILSIIGYLAVLSVFSVRIRISRRTFNFRDLSILSIIGYLAILSVFVHLSILSIIRYVVIFSTFGYLFMF